MEFICKILGIYSCMLNFSYLQSTLHLMQYTPIETFFPLLNTVFELVNFDVF